MKNELLAQIDNALLMSLSDSAQPVQVIFLAGATTYKVMNKYEHLLQFRKKIENCPGFKESRDPPKIRKPSTKQADAAKLYNRYLRLSKQKDLTDEEREEHLHFAQQIERELCQKNTLN